MSSTTFIDGGSDIQVYEKINYITVRDRLENVLPVIAQKPVKLFMEQIKLALDKTIIHWDYVRNDRELDEDANNIFIVGQAYLRNRVLPPNLEDAKEYVENFNAFIVEADTSGGD